MINRLYKRGGMNHFLLGDVHWLTDDIKVAFVDTTMYTVDLEHEFLTDVPSGARVAISPALSGKTAVDGVGHASNTLLTTVSGPPVGAIVLFKATGSDATSVLVAYEDTMPGLPLTPNGGAVLIQWSAAGILEV